MEWVIAEWDLIRFLSMLVKMDLTMAQGKEVKMHQREAWLTI